MREFFFDDKTDITEVERSIFAKSAYLYEDNIKDIFHIIFPEWTFLVHDAIEGHMTEVKGVGRRRTAEDRKKIETTVYQSN